MADQETRERDDAGSSDATSETGSSTDGATEESAAEDSAAESSGSSGSSSGTSDSSGGERAGTGGSAGDDGGSAEDGGSGGGDTTTSGGSAPSPARRSENHAKPQAPSDSDREAQEANRRSFLGGGRSDDAPTGERRRASVDVGELVWKVANVLATVIRVVTLVFAVVLVADIALSVVGVNPANGVASFLRGFADTVVLGFRDLFLPADPTIALVVNYGIAAVFWVVVGGFLSAGIRFLAARIN